MQLQRSDPLPLPHKRDPPNNVVHTTSNRTIIKNKFPCPFHTFGQWTLVRLQGNNLFNVTHKNAFLSYDVASGAFLRKAGGSCGRRGQRIHFLTHSHFLMRSYMAMVVCHIECIHIQNRRLMQRLIKSGDQWVAHIDRTRAVRLAYQHKWLENQMWCSEM